MTLSWPLSLARRPPHAPPVTLMLLGEVVGVAANGGEVMRVAGSGGEGKWGDGRGPASPTTALPRPIRTCRCGGEAEGVAGVNLQHQQPPTSSSLISLPSVALFCLFLLYVTAVQLHLPLHLLLPHLPLLSTCRFYKCSHLLPRASAAPLPVAVAAPAAATHAAVAPTAIASDVAEHLLLLHLPLLHMPSAASSVAYSG
ncbi:unnamed protein product [Closterium sp. NIES-54]